MKRLEVILKDILFQLQQQGQAQGQEQGQAQGQEQGQAQGQTQNDRTKFENNGNPNVIVKNEANALSIAAIVIVLLFLKEDGYKKGKMNKESFGEIVNMLKEFNNSSE
ncbi:MULTISPECIES: hypothetical protein [Clostridia]|uniref:hypothetical protein n=1 Tax=Clostridia TaxID=186801 RepID=UPI0011C23965|nr:MULTISPECIES: hypothetical protein [Clostridia]